jgi:membrane protease YdiL (CAAX protease family)
MVSTSQASVTNWPQRLSLAKPVWTSLALLAIAFIFKWVDTFVLRLDERLGEIILCKALGFALVVAFVLACGRNLRDVGLHAKRLGQSLLIGIAVTALALAVSYGAEFAIQRQSKIQPVFELAAIDPKAGVSGGLLFALWLTFGNVVNAFMEEGLFRGVMIRLFRVRLSFWRANWLQAFLFGIWHLPWVLKWVQTGQIEAQGGIVFASIMQFLPMLLIGCVWGYLYLKTGNLWTCWVAHMLNNTVWNLVHVTTINGMDSGLAIRGPAYLVTAFLCMFLVKYLAERFQMPQVKPWGQWEDQ